MTHRINNITVAVTEAGVTQESMAGVFVSKFSVRLNIFFAGDTEDQCRVSASAWERLRDTIGRNGGRRLRQGFARPCGAMKD